MKRFRNRTMLVGVLAFALLATVACQPTRAFFEVTNDSGAPVDFIYSEDFIDLSEFGRDYASLSIGDRDTYQGCTVCDFAPGEVYRFDEPFREGQTIILAAREAESNTMIFIRRYTWQELFDLEWKVSLVDENS